MESLFAQQESDDRYSYEIPMKDSHLVIINIYHVNLIHFIWLKKIKQYLKIELIPKYQITNTLLIKKIYVYVFIVANFLVFL